MKAKLIEYAYPTSTTATKNGYGKTGCWYVVLYDNIETLKDSKEKTFFGNKQDAINYAESLPNPYGWMHKYFLNRVN